MWGTRGGGRGTVTLENMWRVEMKQVALAFSWQEDWEEGVYVVGGGVEGIIPLASSPSWKHSPAFECAEALGQVTSLTSCGLLLLQ